MKKALVISADSATLATLRDVLRHCGLHDALIRPAGGLQEAYTLLAQGTSFDLVVLDIDMPEGQRLDGAEILIQQCHNTPLVVVSAAEPDDDVVRSVDIGASGYLLKTDNAETLAAALRQVLEGGLYLPDMPPEHFTWF